MYTRTEPGEWHWDGDDMVKIMDPDGVVICFVPLADSDALLSHLNRFS